MGTTGKIGNVLVGSRAETTISAASVRWARPASPEAPQIGAHSHAVDLVSDPSSTLFIIPCSSAKKSPQEAPGAGPSLLDALSPALAQRLKHARDATRSRAHVNETTLAPAWQRYDGTLYRTAAQALADIQDCRLDMLIVSGGYGLVLAAEPIGIYDAIFHLSSWPRGLLEDVLIDYAQRRKMSSVRAITSATGGYRKLLTRVRWSAAGIKDAMLFSPRAGPGAMVLSPRAQGEALTALLRGTLDESWRSSAGLRLDTYRMA